MSDDLFKNLQALYERNTRRFDAPIMESYDQFNELDNAPATVDQSHPKVYPQPDVDKGIVYINPKAVPNRYKSNGGGYMVAYLTPDQTKPYVSRDSLEGYKLDVMPISYKIVSRDGDLRFIQKDRISQAQWDKLLLQPDSLDRFKDVNKFGIGTDDKDSEDYKRRKQAINPNVQNPDGSIKGDKTAQDKLRRYVGHRVAGDRGGEPMNPTAAMLQYPKDLETGKTTVQQAKDTAANTPDPGTPAYYEYINLMRKEKGLPPIPQSQWKLKR
jgi:hypothetical protein